MNSMQNDSIRVFKRECRNYFYYLSDIQILTQRIEGVDTCMCGVHSIDSIVLGENCRNHNPFISYMVAKTKLEEELKEKEEKILRIINAFQGMPDTSYRCVIWMLYVQDVPKWKVAECFDLNPDYLSQLISDEFERTDWTYMK
ncbi:MAG: hypothetical protein EOM64_03755 [Erysipelotrichia bacterium]|nr:hypothetical protein [Erysipelotrichia bacterium]